MKVCTKCQIPQPLENFNNDKYKKDGKKSQCKSCCLQHREENKENILLKKKLYYQENKESISLKAKQHRDKNKEESALRQKRWYDNNKEKRKQYLDENKEKVCENKKRWCEQNKEIISLKRKQRHEQNKSIISLRHKQWREKNKEIVLSKQKQWRQENTEELKVKRKRYRQTSTGRAVYKNTFHKRRIIKKQGDVTTAQLKELLDNSTHCFYCKNPLILNNVHIDHYIPLAKGGLHTITNLRVACKKCNLQKGKKMPEEFALTMAS